MGMNNLAYYLPLAVAAPIFSVLLMLCFPQRWEKMSRALALSGFLLPALISVFLIAYYPGDGLQDGYAYLGAVSVGLDYWGIVLSFGLNGISLPLFGLAAWVGLAAGLVALNRFPKEKSLYWMLLLAMHGGLLGAFASTNLFFFFFFHELALIPTFIAIGRWGGHGRRSTAIEMAIYLTFGGLVTLAGLIALYQQVVDQSPSFDISILTKSLALIPMGDATASTIFGLLLIGFGVLVSLFPFHSWAAKGYAAAPAPITMMHAGVLKKFGLYGLIQVAVPLLSEAALDWTNLLMILGLCNVLWIGWVTIAQIDLKLMLGYSSVMHMGYAFLGIATLSVVGLGGVMVLMVGHGLTVALLFLLATEIHQRTGTYVMAECSGLYRKTPVLSAFFIAATFASLGLPGFLNFWGELTIFLSIWEWNRLAAILAVFGIVLSAVYGLRAVAQIFYGKAMPRLLMNEDLSWSSRWPAILLFIPLLGFGIYPKPLTDLVDRALSHSESVPMIEFTEIQPVVGSSSAPSIE